MQLYKYQGAGNDFLIADNRRGDINLTIGDIRFLCDRRYGVGADGLMLLEDAEGYDFRMVYYNSDGSGGMMCGNGGRCIVAFADSMMHLDAYRFVAADGPHEALILDRQGRQTTVKLKMRDVDAITPVADPQGIFLDTGTRHLVVAVSDIDSHDIVGDGRRMRYLPQFGPVGVNVNFIQRHGNLLYVRTYEKGVEDETYACGTGITASAIAEYRLRTQPPTGHPSTDHPSSGRPSPAPCHVDIQALRDRLAVDFTPTIADGVLVGATDVWLTGPATSVAQITL